MNIKKKIFNFIPLIVFLTFWELYSSLSDRNQFLFASPSLVLSSLIENLKNGILIKDFLITSYEIIVGFIIGNIIGSSIGLSLWFSKKVAEISRNYIVALSSIPIFAIAPMMIIWFGTGLYAKIMMVILSTFLMAITQAYEGAKNVDLDQIKLFKSFGASKRQIFQKLIIPSSLLWVFNSLRINIFYAILGAFIGEFISANSGLAYRMIKASGLYDIPLVLSSILLLVILSFILTAILRVIEKRNNSWKMID